MPFAASLNPWTRLQAVESVDDRQTGGRQAQLPTGVALPCPQTVHGRAFDTITPKSMVDFVKDTWFNVGKSPDRKCCLPAVPVPL